MKNFSAHAIIVADKNFFENILIFFTNERNRSINFDLVGAYVVNNSR